MKKKILPLLAFLALFSTKSYTQTEGKQVTLAVMPFRNGAGTSGIQAVVSQLEAMVLSEFSGKQRFVVIDRSQFNNVLVEQETQKGDIFINGKVVEQGKALGAQYLISGVITEYAIKPVRFANYNTSPVTYYNQNRLFIKASIQVINVETGQTVNTLQIISPQEGYADEGNLFCYTEKKIRKEIRKVFPSDIKIIKVEETDKKGFPKTVLVSGGEMFGDETNKGKGACPDMGGGVGGAIVGLFAKRDKTDLTVFIEEDINGYARRKKIGELRFEKVEGDVATFKVKDGEKEIKEALDTNKKLVFEISKN